jgi:hypothetical protein
MIDYETNQIKNNYDRLHKKTFGIVNISNIKYVYFGRFSNITLSKLYLR